MKRPLRNISENRADSYTSLKTWYLSQPIIVKEVPDDYFAKVYTNEEEIKKVILDHVDKQRHIKYTLDFMNKLSCFQPDDIKTMKEKGIL